MKKSTISKQWSYLTDLFSTNAVKSHKLPVFWLMLLTLLLVPSRMVAQTTTKDPRYDLFNSLEGITDVTFTDNAEYPWKMLDLTADGMPNVSSYFTEESKGLMSSNYSIDSSESETVVNFKVEKPILFSFKYLVSSNSSDEATITIDNKNYGTIGGKKQIEIKELLSVGEHSLKLSYKKDNHYNYYADRAFIYDMNTTTTFSDYAVEYNASNNTLTFKNITSDDLESLDLSHIVIVNNEQTVSNMCTHLGIQSSNIKNIIFEKSFNSYTPTSLKAFFCDCTTLNTIKGLEYLNTAEVTDMSDMFYNCIKLSSLDLSKFNTANVTTMFRMFKDCEKLSSLNISNFNTENVTDMSSMFEYCPNLDELNLSSFNTAKVKNMANMFYNCQKLSSLDLSKFNTANVTNMEGMFGVCSSLTKLDLSIFNTANVTNMGGMFETCSSLTKLDLSNFNTENVTHMGGMFYSCSSLIKLDLSNFNTENVTHMGSMFVNCNTLTSLDLSNFNTENVTNMGSMFYDCSTLQTIYVSEKFVTTNVNSDYNMFFACKNLKGFIDYINNTDKIDHNYANYKTGYFTKLVGKNGNDKIGAVGEVLTAESLALVDDKDLVVYEPFAVKAASYSRTMKEGTTWGTLCLPFYVPLEGQNFRAFTLLSVKENAIELEEIKTPHIQAGYPVIIKMNDGETNLNFSVEYNKIKEKPLTSKPADGNYQLQGLYTQKEFSKDVDNNCYIVKGNKLMNPAMLLENKNVKKVASKPFRAYMVDKPSAPAAGAKMFSIGISDSTTAIDSLNTIANDNAIYYDLQGKRLNEPQKGINIVKRGGKTMKVIIK